MLPLSAHAHTGHGATSGFLHGLGHPVGGLDHILAMLAVGLWAAQIGGRALWAVPATFVGVMVGGALLGFAGLSLPFVEGGILASVFGLGVLIAVAVRLPLPASMACVGFFALFHGHAHGAELPAATSAALYAAGFVLSTIFLHATGIVAGLAMGKWTSPLTTRLAGVGICCAAIGLWVAAR